MKRLLIANRGEIALRILRAARDLKIETVAIYAEADRESPAPRLADQAYCLGDGGPRETYLDAAKIIAIARQTGADAVHPGYGLLSENADFARAVIAAGLIWVGPPPDVIALLGDKRAARDLARKVGAPLALGSDGTVATAADAAAIAARIGLPVAIKAAFGGGGRGIRVVRDMADLPEAFATATREAAQAFGRGDCYVEQFLDRPRHIEVQVLADHHGHILTLGTRDCTLQRRNQKLIEEAPAPDLTPAQRSVFETAATEICRAAGYRNAGTVEFLLSRDGVTTFLEVNTRLQVEHPVTEEIHGIDIVTWQLRIAAGEVLPDIAVPRGHAMEFRINAEDSGRGFLPTPGKITALHWPFGPGVRIDSGVQAGQIVPQAFDSLIAKIIIWGEDRATCLARARRALAEAEIAGIATTLPFHRAMLENPALTATDARMLHTRWIEEEMPPLPPSPRVDPASDDTWRGQIEIDGRLHRVALPAALFGQSRPAAPPQPEVTGDLSAPFAGQFTRWMVADGATITAGAPIAVMEAMKAEHQLIAPRSGVITQLVATDTMLNAGDLIARITP